MTGPRTVSTQNARFQILTPSLIRMEYSASGKFTDAPTVSVLNRDDWPDTKFDANVTDGWLLINTEKMRLKYKVGSGAFNTDNLMVSWDGNNWRPGDIDDANLGGVPPSMDNVKELVTSPGALSRKGYFLLDDSRSPVRDAESDWIVPRHSEGSQDWYFFIYNHDYQHMLAELSRLLGPIPMIPRYVLGAWFTSRAAYSQNEWEMIAERFREESLPLDILVLDSCSWTNVIWSGYDWDLEQLPDPQGFFKWTKDRGFKVSMNEHYNGLTPESDHNFETIRREMNLPADTKEIGHDIAIKKYADLFMNLLHKPAFDMGLAFWWQDGWAPATMEGLDPGLWTREVEYIGSEKITGKRAFMFCRLGSGWGSHRYGSYFTGDMFSNWPTLEIMVDSMIKGGNMLSTWMNHDTGAIFGVKIDDELYLRWLQFGAFNPIFRLHSLWGMRLPWEYGEAGVECYRKFVELRYSLIPYIYTYSRIAHETGLPVASGMYILYPEQEDSYKYPYQYMFGKEILVAPITVSGNGKPVIKEIFLPAGENWFDYFTGELYTGGQVMSYECPIDRMPLFIRAGSIIPLAPKMDYSDQRPIDPLTIDIYAGKSAEFSLYEDDGISLDYRKGSYSLTDISFKSSGINGNYKIGIGPVIGRYTNQPQKRMYIIKVHGLAEPESVVLDNKPLTKLYKDQVETGWVWDNAERVITIRLSVPISIEDKISIQVENAGIFQDSLILQKAIALREKIRKVRFLEKLKYAELLGGRDHCKPPSVIQTLDKVEEQLNRIVADPRGFSKSVPDFNNMVEQVIQSFTDKPFESKRAIPDLNESSRSSGEDIADKTFTQDEIGKMIAILKED